MLEQSVEGFALQFEEVQRFVLAAIVRNGLLSGRQKLLAEVLANELGLVVAPTVEDVVAVQRAVALFDLAELLELVAGEFRTLSHNDFITLNRWVAKSHKHTVQQQFQPVSFCHCNPPTVCSPFPPPNPSELYNLITVDHPNNF
jgi:hypothetical protein